MKRIVLFSLMLCFIAGLTAQNENIPYSQILIRGAYKSFDEFLSNNPQIQDSFYFDSVPRMTKEWANTYSLTPRYYKSKKRIKNIWGFCDGKRAFICHLGEFFQLKIEETQYSFEGYDISNDTYSSSLVLLGAVGGVISGLNSQPQAINKKIEYIYNINSGLEFPPRNHSSIKLDHKYAEVIFYRKSKDELEIPIDIFILDSLKFSFVVNSYRSLLIDTIFSPLKICLKPGFLNCTEINLDINEEKYIQCRFQKDDDMPQLIPISTADGEFHASKPKKEQLKRDK